QVENRISHGADGQIGHSLQVLFREGDREQAQEQRNAQRVSQVRLCSEDCPEVWSRQQVSVDLVILQRTKSDSAVERRLAPNLTVLGQTAGEQDLIAVRNGAEEERPWIGIGIVRSRIFEPGAELVEPVEDEKRLTSRECVADSIGQ